MDEIELLLTEILNCPRHQLYLDKQIALDVSQDRLLTEALSRRGLGEPIQYILGKVDFMGLPLKVNPDVFIPRPETEILVETAIKQLSTLDPRPSTVKIMDIGTGSGCIAIALAKFLKNVRVTATDISKEALQIARQNALLHNVEINFLQSDLFNNYKLQTTNYKLILSNPPYIPSDKIKDLPKEVRSEPRIALDGGRGGLDFYRRIIKGSPKYLEDNGYLIMEIGFGQRTDIKNMFKNSQHLEIIDIIKDYNNIDRVIVAKYKF